MWFTRQSRRRTLLLRGKDKRAGLPHVLPMFAVSIVYALVHYAVAPVQAASGYAMHFTGAMFRTLGRYWTWSVGPTFLYTPFVLPKWVLPVGIAVVSAGLLGFLRMEAARRRADRPVLVWHGIWRCWRRCCRCAITRPSITSSFP